MKRTTVLLLASLSFPVAFACTMSGTDQSQVVEADTAGVMKAYRQRVAGLEEDDIERWLEVHAGHVRFIDPNGPDIVGKDSLRAWAQPFFDGFTMKFNETVEEIHADRELGSAGATRHHGFL